MRHARVDEGLAATHRMTCRHKREVERRVDELPDEHRRQWYDGTYQQAREAEEKRLAQECEGFEAAPAFDGARPGHVYKRGPAGLGYYRDVRAAEGSAGSAVPEHTNGETGGGGRGRAAGHRGGHVGARERG